MRLNSFRPGLAAALFAVAMSALTAMPARADFDAGLDAYDGGRYADAVAHWEPLAANGHANAQLALAGLYRHGLGVPADAARAARLYRMAAERGLAVAQVNLGEMYARGEGVARDSVQAFVWYRRAAALGNAWAVRAAAAVAARLTPAERERAMRELAADPSSR